VFESFPIRTAGKSGTGERFKADGSPMPDLSWYCGYAPADKPVIAACGFIDGGGGGSTAAGPIVLDIFQSFFKKRIEAASKASTDDDPNAALDAAATEVAQ
jgi:penicillin-binding protein 2